MRKVCEGRLLNPDRAPQVCEAEANPVDCYFNDGEGESADGADAEVTTNEAAINLAPNFAP